MKNESHKLIHDITGTTFVRKLDVYTLYHFRIRRGYSKNGNLTWGNFTKYTWGKTDEGSK